MNAVQGDAKKLRDIDEITLDFDIAQATVKSLCELLWGLGDTPEVEIEFTDVGRAGHAAAERMTQAFEDIQKYSEAESKGGRPS